MRKTRHFIETFQHFTIIFIDHVVNVFIIKQTTFIFNNINKLNLRLIRVFIYLSQFRLNIRYRSDKRHVLSDVLSRLSTNRSFMNENENLDLKSYHVDLKNSSINDQCFVYHETLINMFVVFRQRLIDEYVKEKT